VQLRRRPPRCLHHFVNHPAKEEGIGLFEIPDRMTTQVLGCRPSFFLTLHAISTIVSRNRNRGARGSTVTLMEYVGRRIRDFRTSYGGGPGISQDALAKALGVATNTVSRWETAVYRPTIEDLDKLARFFGKSILEFFPKEEVRTKRDEKIDSLLRTAKQLKDADVEELRRYAEFRRARNVYAKRPPGRKGKK
jgi:transcriptional regulator with XRE-family HTH domain